jgi:hypothetical protein
MQRSPAIDSCCQIDLSFLFKGSFGWELVDFPTKLSMFQSSVGCMYGFDVEV